MKDRHIIFGKFSCFGAELVGIDGSAKVAFVYQAYLPVTTASLRALF